MWVDSALLKNQPLLGCNFEAMEIPGGEFMEKASQANRNFSVKETDTAAILQIRCSSGVRAQLKMFGFLLSIPAFVALLIGVNVSADEGGGAGAITVAIIIGLLASLLIWQSARRTTVTVKIDAGGIQPWSKKYEFEKISKYYLSNKITQRNLIEHSVLVADPRTMGGAAGLAISNTAAAVRNDAARSAFFIAIQYGTSRIPIAEGIFDKEAEEVFAEFMRLVRKFSGASS